MIRTPSLSAKAGNVPLPDSVVTGAKGWTPSPNLRDSSRGTLGALKVLSIAWIFGLYRLSFPLPCLTPGALAPLLRARSISPVTLGLLGKGN